MKVGFGIKYYLTLAVSSLLLLTTACVSSQGSLNTPGTSPPGRLAVQDGIVTEHNDPTFKLVTPAGRSVFNLDSNTRVITADPNSNNNITRAVNDSDLYLGQKLLVEYYPDKNNLATRIVDKDYKAKVFFPLVGTIKEFMGDRFYMNAAYLKAQTDLLIWLTKELIVVKPDGSPGNANDLSLGMNIRVFCNPGTMGAIVIEIQ